MKWKPKKKGSISHGKVYYGVRAKSIALLIRFVTLVQIHLVSEEKGDACLVQDMGKNGNLIKRSCHTRTLVGVQKLRISNLLLFFHSQIHLQRLHIHKFQ